MAAVVDAIGESDRGYGFMEMLGDVRNYVIPYMGLFTFATILRLTSDVVWLYPAWALGQMTTFFAGYSPGQPLDYFWLLLGLWFLAGVYRYTSLEVSKYFGFLVSERIALDAKIEAIKHLFSLDMAWHESEYAGSKLKRIDNGGDGLKTIIRAFFVNFIESTVNIIGISFILLSLGGIFSLSLVLFIITYYLLSYALTSKAKLQSRIVSQHEEVAEGISFESISNISTIKMMGISQQITVKLVEVTKKLMAEIKRRILYFRTREAVLNNYALVFRLLALAYIGYNIFLGRFEVGVLVMFYAYFDKIWQSTAEMSTVTNDLIVNMIYVGRLKAMMRIKPTIESGGKNPMTDSWQAITVKNLSFSYNRPVLKNVSFKVRRGERVGIVGPSGAGKSTLFKLLLKVHENYEGEILIDEKPLKEIDRSSYMKRISVVLQDTEVFNLSMRENIEIVGGHERNLDKTITMAHLGEVVARMPEGVDTVIGEKGIRLSGGEKQRLGIARAIYKNPDILFLDEATSHLDANSEGKIRDSLKNFLQGVTAVVIAHRLSTIREMDRIIVLDKGVIVEEGKFEQLIEGKGLFYNLWQKQKL